MATGDIYKVTNQKDTWMYLEVRINTQTRYVCVGSTKVCGHGTKPGIVYQMDSNKLQYTGDNLLQIFKEVIHA